MNKNKNTYIQLLVQTLLLGVLLILLNLISGQWYVYTDLTEDKLFTLEPSSRNLLNDVSDQIYVEVLLDGDLNSSFGRLKNRTSELLGQFAKINGNIDYDFVDPSAGSVEDINARRENYRKDGILPTTVFQVENDQRVEKLIYPYAIINWGQRSIPVNLLEPMSRGENEEEAINRSVMLLEYKLISTISKLIQPQSPIVFFTEGNGELEARQTAMLETLLSRNMRTGRINMDSIYQIDKAVDLLIVARPQENMSLRNQFILDQYIMNGGKVIWLVDQFYIDLDSINNNKVYVPKPVDHGLDDMFFKYGVRLGKDVILDLQNQSIPQVIGMAGGQVQQQLFPWVFHPLLQGNPESNVVKNIDRVASTFPSTIEILNNESTEASVLLTSSEYSRYQVYPSINISFEILRLEQRPEAYNKSHLPVAVLLEGSFDSYFKNRVSQEMSEGLAQLNTKFVERSPMTQQVFITDVDIVKNLYDEENNRIGPLGYNKWERFTYKGNEDFIINTIDYMLDSYGLAESRSKNYKLRLLDQVSLNKNKLKWQLINVVIPVVFVALCGIGFAFLRRRRYSVTKRL